MKPKPGRRAEQRLSPCRAAGRDRADRTVVAAVERSPRWQHTLADLLDFRADTLAEVSLDALKTVNRG